MAEPVNCVVGWTDNPITPTAPISKIIDQSGYPKNPCDGERCLTAAGRLMVYVKESGGWFQENSPDKVKKAWEDLVAKGDPKFSEFVRELTGVSHKQFPFGGHSDQTLKGYYHSLDGAASWYDCGDRKMYYIAGARFGDIVPANSPPPTAYVNLVNRIKGHRATYFKSINVIYDSVADKYYDITPGRGAEALKVYPQIYVWEYGLQNITETPEFKPSANRWEMSDLPKDGLAEFIKNETKELKGTIQNAIRASLDLENFGYELKHERNDWVYHSAKYYKPALCFKVLIRIDEDPKDYLELRDAIGVVSDKNEFTFILGPGVDRSFLEPIKPELVKKASARIYLRHADGAHELLWNYSAKAEASKPAETAEQTKIKESLNHKNFGFDVRLDGDTWFYNKLANWDKRPYDLENIVYINQDNIGAIGTLAQSFWKTPNRNKFTLVVDEAVLGGVQPLKPVLLTKAAATIYSKNEDGDYRPVWSHRQTQNPEGLHEEPKTNMSITYPAPELASELKELARMIESFRYNKPSSRYNKPKEQTVSNPVPPESNFIPLNEMARAFVESAKGAPARVGGAVAHAVTIAAVTQATKALCLVTAQKLLAGKSRTANRNAALRFINSIYGECVIGFVLGAAVYFVPIRRLSFERRQKLSDAFIADAVIKGSAAFVALNAKGIYDEIVVKVMGLVEMFDKIAEAEGEPAAQLTRGLDVEARPSYVSAPAKAKAEVE